MAHIDIGTSLPGIAGLLHYRPETAEPLTALAEALLRGPNSLSRGERELIATVVSRGNQCDFCARSHGAVATRQLDGTGLDVDDVEGTADSRLRALLVIAEKVRRDGREVSIEDVTRAREAGATEVEVHDTVLIAAAFCMFNRYVDGLGADTPSDPNAYAAMAVHLCEHGYARTGRTDVPDIG